MNSFPVSAQNIARTMFLLLFPVVFIYGALVEFNIIAPVLGGAVGVLTLVAFISLTPFVCIDYRKYDAKQKSYIYIFIALLVYVSGYLSYHYFFGNSYHQTYPVIKQWLVLLVSWCALFSLGSLWPEHLKKHEIIFLSGLIVAMSFLLYQSIHYLHSDPSKSILTLGRADPEKQLMTYQGYARSMSVTGLVLLATIRKQYIFWPISTLVIISLVLIGSRTEIVGVAMVFPILLYFLYCEKPKLTLIISVSVFLALAIFTLTKLDASNYVRHMELFSMSESKSYQLRYDLSVEALNEITSKPVSGDFSGHVRKHEGLGHYAHNILSAWRQLGIFGFLLYSALLIIPVAGSFMTVIKNSATRNIDIWRITLVLSSFMLLMALGAKSIFSSMFALAWGLYISALGFTRAHDEVEVKNL